MGQIQRIWLAMRVTGLMAVAAVVHFRLGVDHLYPFAQEEFKGPFTTVVDTLEVTVPVVIGGILLMVWVWVLVSPAQEERARNQLPPPR